MKSRILLAILILPFIAACSMQSMATRTIGKIATRGMIAVEDERDIPFAEAASPALIKTLEVLHYGDPKDARMLALLSRAYGTYTFGFLEQELIDAKATGRNTDAITSRMSHFYRMGREYGIAALAQKKSMARGFKEPLPQFKKAVAGLSKKHVPALFWTAFSWANWLNMNLDDVGAIIDLARIQAMIDRVIELDPTYYHAQAHTFRGVMAASRPKMLGGDPELARIEFETAIAAAPNYLMTKVLFAQYYCRQVQNLALFTRTLEEVIAADANKLRGENLSNALAQKRAKVLLGMKKKLF